MAGMQGGKRCQRRFPWKLFSDTALFFFPARTEGLFPDLPDDYEGHPQRRDFPIGGEPVLFTHNEKDVPGWIE